MRLLGIAGGKAGSGGESAAGGPSSAFTLPKNMTPEAAAIVAAAEAAGQRAAEKPPA